MNPCNLVRSSCLAVSSSSTSSLICKIDETNLDKFVLSLSSSSIECVGKDDDDIKNELVHWDQSGWHLSPQITSDHACAQYCLVLDALNFCFWPTNGFEYDHLACGLRDAYLSDNHCFDADRLSCCDEETLKRWVSSPSFLPNLAERAARIREVGDVLTSLYYGSALTLIAAAKNSAVELVRLVTSSFPGFRDEALFEGRPVYFYKRAQIFAGDIWGCFGRQVISGADRNKDSLHPAAFFDMDQLTCFADYRIPQLLRKEGVLQFCKELEEKVNSKVTLLAGGVDEVSIRACTVTAVEKIREKMNLNLSVTLDWLLWQKGEEQKDTLEPHHRVLTIFY
jgi:hypothetical protein